jgi:hypothetical protein
MSPRQEDQLVLAYELDYYLWIFQILKSVLIMAGLY